MGIDHRRDSIRGVMKSVDELKTQRQAECQQEKDRIAR